MRLEFSYGIHSQLLWKFILSSYGNSFQPHSLLVPTGLTYTQRVGAALVAFIEFYDYIHGDHNIKASELDVNMRASRADTAVALSIEHQRGMIALIGTHRRRTYAHDLVYGLHVLYRLFGRPWNAATEGNEHAHQDMKKYFLRLRNSRRYSRHGHAPHDLKLM